MRSPRFLLALGASVVLSAVSAFTADPSATAMASAADRFLSSLTPPQRQAAQFAMDDGERTRWHFIPSGPPPSFPRNGLPIADMQPAQRQMAHDLLRTGLSQKGYLTATQIMDLETTLGAIEGQLRARGGSTPFVRDPERYFFSVFGTPASGGTWGWRVEGHHVSLHFTIANGSIAVSTPTFFGSNPAEVRDGDKKGLRVLGQFEEVARALLDTLDAGQKTRAILSGAAPGDILTTNRLSIDPLSPDGLAASAMTEKQRALLIAIVDTYSAQMTADIASLRTAQWKKAGPEKMTFAWAGSTERGQKHYYRVQGPTFLIEYDNTQNDGNHVHSVWRDFAGDFGRDVLREHLAQQRH